MHSKTARGLHIAIAVAVLGIAVLAAFEGSWTTAIGSSAAFASLVLSFLAFRYTRRQAVDTPDR